MTETKSSREFLEKILPLRFKPDKAAGIDLIAQLNLKGENGGNWIVTIKDQQLHVAQGTHPSPTLTVTIAERDFLDIINGKSTVERAFFTGRIDFKGSMALALKLRDTGIL